jgi:hypothetical protein
MSNETIPGADRATHLKIVTMSLAASIIVVAVALAAHTTSNEASARLQARGPVIKAGAPIITTTNDTTAIR